MYSLFKEKPLRRLATTELLPGAFAFLIAELFYKFHSFMLECSAFLVTWFVFSWLTARVAKQFGRSKTELGANTD